MREISLTQATYPPDGTVKHDRNLHITSHIPPDGTVKHDRNLPITSHVPQIEQ